MFGIASSITCALNSIYTAKCLPKVEGSVWRLTFYNNLNSLFLSIPIIGLLEYQPIKEHFFHTRYVNVIIFNTDVQITHKTVRISFLNEKLL